jgi:hypothetical protein
MGKCKLPKTLIVADISFIQIAHIAPWLSFA